MSRELANARKSRATCSRWARRWDDSARRSIRPAPDPMSRSRPAAASPRYCRSRRTYSPASPRAASRLIYGNRSMARTMFLEDTLALKNRHLGRFSVHFVMSREPQHTALLNGRIDAQKVRDLAREMPDIASADEYFVCGPGRMVDEVREAIKLLNDSAPVRIERFAAGAGARPVAASNGSAAIRRRRPARGGSPRDGLGSHGRQAPQFPHGGRRCVGTRGGGTRGPRAAVFLPFGHLRHVPRPESSPARPSWLTTSRCSRGRSRRASSCVARRGRPPLRLS